MECPAAAPSRSDWRRQAATDRQKPRAGAHISQTSWYTQLASGYIVVQRGLDEQASSSAVTAAGSSSVQKAFADVTAPARQVTTEAAPVAKQTTTTTNTGMNTVHQNMMHSSMYADGTFTGAAASQPYGTVQVAVVVSGGRITNVKLLRTPSGGGTTQYINEQALPMLVQEVISAQSGNIDGVSGASLTSPAFIDSINSALAKARA